MLNILRFVAGDAFAKLLAFVAMVWLARALGVGAFGTLEFALALLTWLLVFADGGLEIWATREAARGRDVRELAGQVIPMRLVLSGAASLLLLALIPLLPEYASLRTLLWILAGCLPVQAVNLKWAYLGRERMLDVSAGLVVGQLVFLGGVAAFVAGAADLVLVAWARLASDAATSAWYAVRFLAQEGRFRLSLAPRAGGAMLRTALGYGAAHALALASFNFDSLLLGFLGSAEDVGLYGAAYKPVVAGLALPIAYFTGLYPTMARAWSEGSTQFLEIASRSMRWAGALAVPLGVLGLFFAGDVLALLFGPEYVAATIALQLLSASAVLVVLRGTYRRGLLAAGAVRLDLRSAAAATGANVALNIILIPRFGIAGAASATLASEVIWLTMATWYFNRRVERLPLVSGLVHPAAAAVPMIGWLLVGPDIPWALQAAAAATIYAGVLALLARLSARRSM